MNNLPPETDDRRLLRELAGASLREQRARRRWGVFFRALFFAYLVGITALFFVDGGGDIGDIGGEDGYAAVIDIQGPIFAGGKNSAESVNERLRRAFHDENARGIILQINSPGGSAVESHRIYKEIFRLREKFPDTRLYAVAGDFCASGGYFIAAAADEIYADEGSILGSIGVVFSGFGFVGTMEKLGVQRRIVAAGENKDMLDPFSPQSAADVAALRKILTDIHEVFIGAVRAGRGDKLADDPVLFSGGVFGGVEGLRLGLIDGFDDAGGVARDIIGVDEVVYFSPTRDLWGELFDSFAARLGLGEWTGGVRL